MVKIQSGCAGCAYCKLICAASAIRVEAGRAEIGLNCTNCNQCVKYCPLRLIQAEGGCGADR